VATSEPGGSRRSRFVIYLYSTKNMVGSALALGGLALYFTGVVHDLWPVVVAGLYAFGVLVTPRPKSVDLHDFDPRDVDRALDRLVKSVAGRLPRDVQGRVESIVETIDGILPRTGQLAPGSPELFILQRTATDYLPTALESYLNLPRAYATMHQLEDGKTARQLLDEQLDLLGEQMDEVADAVAKNDADRLMAHGRFLEERFGKSDLALPGGDGSPSAPPAAPPVVPPPVVPPPVVPPPSLPQGIPPAPPSAKPPSAPPSPSTG